MRTPPLDFRHARGRALRLTVFRRDGFACRRCGWAPKAVPPDYHGESGLTEWRTEQQRRWARTIQVQGCVSLEVDHVIPRANGGPNHLDNLQALCSDCNRTKGGSRLVTSRSDSLFVPVHVELAEHPKMEQAIGDAGIAAFYLYVAALGYAKKQMTDGFIPRTQATKLLAVARVPLPKVAGALVAAGLWEHAEGGFTVHNYLRWNNSAEHINGVRAARSAAGKNGGRPPKREPKGKQTGKQTETNGGSKPEAKGEAKGNPEHRGTEVLTSKATGLPPPEAEMLAAAEFDDCFAVLAAVGVSQPVAAKIAGRRSPDWARRWVAEGKASGTVKNLPAFVVGKDKADEEPPVTSTNGAVSHYPTAPWTPPWEGDEDPVTPSAPPAPWTRPDQTGTTA